MHPENLTHPTETALGVCLGSREVGLVVLTRERLLDFEVKDLHKLVSREAKESRIRNAVTAWLDHHRVTRIVLVVPTGNASVVVAMHAWLAAEADARSIPLHVHDRADLRERYARDPNPSTRRLSETLAEEYPELWHHAPSAEPIPGADRVPELGTTGRRTRTSKQRYWSRMFLALAAARTELDDLLLAKLTV